MSLRVRVILAMSLIAVVVLGGAFLTTRLAEQRLMDQVDRRLSGASAPLDRGFDPRDRFGPGATDPTTRPLPDGRRARGFNEFFVAVIQSNGTVLVLGQPNVSRHRLSPPVIDAGRARAAAASSRPVLYTVTAHDSDLRYRVTARAEPRTGDTFLLAAPLASVDASTNELQTIAFAVAAVVLAVLGLVTWWVIRLGIRPLNRMASAAVTIAEDDLTRRVPEASKGTEAGDLSLAINNMLGRLEDSFAARAETDARLRQFVGDASHELRTPVQTIRGYSELYAAGALISGEQLDDAMRRTGQEAVRMATLIDELLTLARLDQARPVERTPVDLRTLAEDAVADARAIQPERTITLDTDCRTTRLTIRHGRRRRLLRQVFANVVGNALVHTPTDSAIAVTLRGASDHVNVVVADHGPGMNADIATRAFERFVRADPARTRRHGGSGLGLAIVHDAVVAHGGTVMLESDLERGTVVAFSIPRWLSLRGHACPRALKNTATAAHEHHDAHPRVQPQWSDGVRRIDPHLLHHESERGVARGVQREELTARQLELPVDREEREPQRNAPQRLVQERGLERGIAQVAGRAMGTIYLHRPRQRRGPTEQLLVEPVPPPADRLREREAGHDAIGQVREDHVAPTRDDEHCERAADHAAPDAEAAAPDLERCARWPSNSW